MLEIWKDIKDYEGLYQVSNLGRVKSLNYNHTSKERLLNLCKNRYGYLTVVLYKNRKGKRFSVHRLVAISFLPNPENKSCINHKIEGDEGKKINIVYLNEDGTIDEKKSTIEWFTVKENNNYGTRIERAAKLQAKPVLQISLTGELIREWKSIAECGRNGFKQGNVCLCCRGKQKTHKGFRFMYK